LFSIKLKGNTGLELVKQALERDHQVTALVRNPGALEAFSKNENFKVIIIR
jgi:putative NADH-flavin reductase